jgi:negative regulator of flagellin synthesis FlgM
MKIGNPADKPAPAAAPAVGHAANGHAPAASAGALPVNAIPASADPSAKIELSSAASTLLAGGATPEFDSAKVDRISKAIEDGSFKINPEAIADKLIANAHEVLAKVQS